MTFEQFRAKWGRKWGNLVEGEMFKDAQATIEENSEILQIFRKSHAEIETLGRVFMAEQRGFLIYSNALRYLHQEAIPTTDLGEPSYPDPLTEEEPEPTKKPRHKR